MSLFVERVRTNMKGGADVVLGQRTVVVGRNGSGKSTLIQSIELATCGYVSDMEGRDQVKQKAALQRLFSDSVDPNVECLLSNGTAFSWSMHRKPDGSLDDLKHIKPITVVWPLRELNETLTGEATAVAAWLEAQALGPLSLEDFLRPLPPEVHADVTKLLKRVGRTDFMNLAREAKDEARSLRQQATRSEKTVEAMTTGISAPMPDDDRESFQLRLRELEARPRGTSQAEFDAMKSDLDRAIEIYLVKQESLATLPQAPAVDGALKKLSAAIKVHQLHGVADGCWVCGVGSSEQIQQQGELLQTTYMTLASAHAVAVQREVLGRELAGLELQLQTKADRLKTVKVVEDVTAEVRSIQGKLASNDAVKRTWANASASRLEVAQLRARADHLSTAAKALAAAGKDLLSSRKQQFEKTVSSFLPNGEHLEVDLDSARVGLMRNGQLHSALSGAEWSRVLLALASVQDHNEAVPSILAPEDRAWDPKTLSSVMSALGKCPAQILLMSTVKPSSVEGWTIVEVGV